MSERFWSPVISGLASIAVVATFQANLLAQAAPSASPRKVVVLGCVKQTGTQPKVELTITDMRGGPAPTFRLDANDSKVSWLVGQTVELAGTIPAAPAASGTAAMAPPRLTVDSVNRIAITCIEPPKSPAN